MLNLRTMFWNVKSTPRCGLSLKAKRCSLSLGLDLIDVMVLASYNLTSSPHFMLFQFLSEHVTCIVARSAPIQRVFTRDSVAIARICYMYGNSVCLSVRLSVCLSVCLSHGWISQKRLKLGSRSFHHTVAPSL